MTLRRRLIVHIGLTVVGAVALAAGAVAGINALRQDFGVALQANAQLRHIYEVGSHVSAAKRSMREHPVDLATARAEVETASTKLARSEAWVGGTEVYVARVRAALADAEAQLRLASKGSFGPAVQSRQVPALDATIAAVAELSSQTRTTLADRQRAADAKHRATRLTLFGFALLVVAGAVVAGVRLYRAVMSPLNRLGHTVRRIAAGRREERVALAGDAELVDLGREFNRMAGELDALCRGLERQVADKSRELVRSERLASVGYLAAGVAHEINNPLGIIAGYGERSLQHIRRGLNDDTAVRVERAIEVMCDEAFRCKGITDRLLSLARPGTDAPEPVCLKSVAEDVIANVAALGDFAGRRVTLEVPEGAFVVSGKAAELKQVVLNLVINAMQAVDARDGRVWVTLRRDDDDDGQVELCVRDDGAGMSPQTLERVFEPFFTERRGDGGGQRGTGLGLCITHAIVAGHGGSIRAESGGTGRGSRFVVSLPAKGRVGLGTN